MKFSLSSWLSAALVLVGVTGCGQFSSSPSSPGSKAGSSCTNAVSQAAASKALTSQTVKALAYKLESYTSQTMGGDRSFGVVLPPGYDEQKNTCYPVIFLLHGGHGNPKTWFELGNAIATLKKLYADGKLPPSIIITPDGNDNRGTSPYWDPEYIDGKNGNVMSAIARELTDVVKQRYRTLPEPKFWAIGGLSSGGWGAMNLALHNPDRFSVVFSHSGYFTNKTPENSPIEFVKTLPERDRKQLKIYLDTGNTDPKYLKENTEFQAVLNELGVKNELNKFSGEHTWRFWKTHLTDSLTFVGNQFKAAESGKSS